MGNLLQNPNSKISNLGQTFVKMRCVQQRIFCAYLGIVVKLPKHI